ncbi:IS607 family transposase [Patescibacteria group bacterium]|nr:IS607 family transposase [Patescibacteria group bacterium]
MSKYLCIVKVAEFFGVSCQTIRNWEKEGYLKESKRTRGNHRRFLSEDIFEEEKEKGTVIYSRVSSHEQKEDLKRQTESLQEYCKENKIENVEIIEDIGSGINYKKSGLKKLIKKITLGKIKRIVISFKDRLLRFGLEILEQICLLKDVELVILHDKAQKGYEYALAEDVLSILTVYSAKIYGKRSHQNRSKTKKT